MGSCKDDTVLSYLAVCILLVLLRHSLRQAPCLSVQPGIRNIYSALLTQGWFLTEVLLTVYNVVLHLERQGVCVYVCMHLHFALTGQIHFEGFRVSRDKFMVKLN